MHVRPFVLGSDVQVTAWGGSSPFLARQKQGFSFFFSLWGDPVQNRPQNSRKSNQKVTKKVTLPLFLPLFSYPFRYFPVDPKVAFSLLFRHFEFFGVPGSVGPFAPLVGGIFDFRGISTVFSADPQIGDKN